MEILASHYHIIMISISTNYMTIGVHPTHLNGLLEMFEQILLLCLLSKHLKKKLKIKKN